MSLFGNLIFGKNNKPDFTPESLPENRVALYFDMLKIRFTGLLQLNLTFLICALPALVWVGKNIIDLEITLAGLTDLEEAGDLIWRYVNKISIGLIPCALLWGPGICGLVKVAQSWASDQHAWIWSDFWQGFKQNWKAGMLTGVLTSAGLFIMNFAFQFYGQMSEQNMIFAFLQWLIVLMTVVFGMALIYVYPLIVTYELKYKQVWRNALLLALGRLPWSVLWGVFTILPVVLCLVGTQLVVMIVVLAYVFILFAFQAFTLTSYTNATFDKVLNPKIPGAQVNRGLRKKEDWELDEDDEDDADDEDDTDDTDDEDTNE